MCKSLIGPSKPQIGATAFGALFLPSVKFAKHYLRPMVFNLGSRPTDGS